MPALLVAAIFRILDSLRVFDVIYVLTSNSSSTMSMSVYARQHLVEFQDVGYGSAASTLLFLVVAVIALLYLYLGRRQLEVRCMSPRLLKKALLRLGFWCLIGILLLYAVFPFYYAIVTSLKPSSTLFEVSYWIDRPDFSNYAAVLQLDPRS